MWNKLERNLWDVRTDERFVRLHIPFREFTEQPKRPLSKKKAASYTASYWLEGPFTDLGGTTHQLKYTPGELTVNGKKTTVESILAMMYGLEKGVGTAKAVDYETGYIPTLSSSGKQEFLPGKFNSAHLYHEKSTFGQAFSVHSLSPTGFAISSKDISITKQGISWETRGVFRVHPLVLQGTHDLIMVTEDPILADYLNEQGICAFALPAEHELNNYNYPELIQDSKVFLLTNNEGTLFDYSIYPFAELCLKNGLNIFRIHAEAAFRTLTIFDILDSGGAIALDAKIRTYSSPVFPRDIPSRHAYNDAHSGKIVPIDPAQSLRNQRFFYYIDNTSSLVISNPIREVSAHSITEYEGVELHHTESINTVCSSHALSMIREKRTIKFCDLFVETQTFLKRYIYLKDPNWYSLVTAWVLGTYFYKAFSAYPYLNLEGEEGSGKTTFLNIIAHLSFNGIVLTDASVPTMIEEVDLRGSTLCVDEFEDFSKKSSHDDLSRFLNGGYNHKGAIRKKRGKTTATYRIYSPKVFAGTGGIKLRTLASRTIPIYIERKPTHIQLDEFIEFDPVVEDQKRITQASALAVPLLHTNDLLLAIHSYPTDVELPISSEPLSNRQFQLAKPLLVVAALVDEEAGASSHVQQHILEGLDSLWNYSEAQVIKNERLLTKQLQEWSKNPDFVSFVHDQDHCWFSSEVWDASPLRALYPNNTKLYRWLKTLGPVKTKSRHFPHLPKDKKGKQIGSGVGFPLNLNIAHQPFRSWFSKK